MKEPWRGGRPWEVTLDMLNTLPIDRRLGPGLWYRRYWEQGESLWAFLLWGHITLLAYTKPAPVADSTAPPTA